MYKRTQISKTQIRTANAVEGETIEAKIRRIVNNKEAISDGAPLVYTDRKEGVQPAYDVRTDRFEIAVEAMDKVTKSHQAKREERHKTQEQKDADKKAAEIAAAAKEGMNKEGNGDPKQN